MNCSQAATRELTDSAGISAWRVRRTRLTSRGFGRARTLSGVAGAILSSGMFRPKRVPAMPMRGSSRSLWLPSGVRLTRWLSEGGAGVGRLTEGSRDVSWRFF